MRYNEKEEERILREIIEAAMESTGWDQEVATFNA